MIIFIEKFDKKQIELSEFFNVRANRVAIRLQIEIALKEREIVNVTRNLVEKILIL